MYKGQSAIFPTGQGGLNAIENVYNIPVTDLLVANNIRYVDYSWRKSPGLGLFDVVPVSGAPVALAGFDWRPRTGLQHQITAWNDGTIYKETGGDIDDVTLVSGVTFGGPVTFVQGGMQGADNTRKLYVYSEGLAPLVLDDIGTTFDPITAESLDWATNKPQLATYHDARIYASGVSSAPHSFYISTLDDHGDFAGTSARVFDCQTGIGDFISCLFSYLPQTLLAFKYPRGICAIDTTDVTSFYLPSTLIRDDIGAAGPFAACKVGTDVCFISSTGNVYSLNALRPDVDPREADITSSLNLSNYINQNVNINMLKYARLVYDETRKELLYTYTSKSGELNDSVLIIDLNDMANQQMKASHDNKGEFYQAVWPYIDSAGATSYLAAGNGGLVYRLNQPNRSIGTNGAYESAFQVPFTDLSQAPNGTAAQKAQAAELAGVQKRFDMLQFTLIPTGAYFMSVDFFIDGVFAKTVTFNLGDDLALFDDAEFDNAVFGGLLSIKRQIPIDLTGDQISWKCYNNNANEDFNISNMTLFYKPLSKEYENV